MRGSKRTLQGTTLLFKSYRPSLDSVVDPRAEPDGHIEQKNLPGVLTPVIRHERKDGVQNRVERSEIVPPNRITKSLRTRLPEPIGRYVKILQGVIHSLTWLV